MRTLVSLVAAALTAVLAVAGAVFAALAPTPVSIGVAAIGGPIAIAWAALGLTIVWRGSGSGVGLLMTFVGCSIALTTTREAGWVVLAYRPELWTDLAWLVAILSESSVWLFVTLSLLLLTFPDGSLPSRRWRFVPLVLVASGAVRQAWGAVDPTPFRPPLEDLPRPFPGPPLVLDAAGFLALLAMLVLIVACAGSLVPRFRRSDNLRRAQLRWLALAGAGVPGFLLVCLGEIVVVGGPSWLSLGVGLAAAIGLPSSIAIAMLRHNLFDIDRAVAVTATYAAASGILVVVFVLVSAAMGILLGQDSVVVAAAATALTAVALSPLRTVLQRTVESRLYPIRQAALAAIESLERRTRTGGARPEELEAELRTALRDMGLRVAYRLPGTDGLVDSSGRAVGAVEAVPVVMGGTEVGALVPSSNAHSPGLLRDIARASGTLVEIVRLRVELTEAVRKLEISRARLVQVGDEERRRLERDLHDGAQQRLVSLGMSLRLAQRHLGDGQVDVDAVIDESVAELGTAVAELRQIAHGLRPSRLDDGLHSALFSLSHNLPVPVELDVSPVTGMPDPILTTVYFVASEALANAVKHASATRIGIRVAQDEREVEVSVRDDGVGGAVMRHGSGLDGLRDRVAALGGSFSLDSAAGGGTVIQVVLPCAS
jgi:signal transduction histidine kinase